MTTNRKVTTENLWIGDMARPLDSDKDFARIGNMEQLDAGTWRITVGGNVLVCNKSMVWETTEKTRGQ